MSTCKDKIEAYGSAMMQNFVTRLFRSENRFLNSAQNLKQREKLFDQ